jgi:hypothetical protein
VIASFTLLTLRQFIIKFLLFNSLESVYSMGENQIKYRNPQCALHAKRKGKKKFEQPQCVPYHELKSHVASPKNRTLGSIKI